MAALLRRVRGFVLLGTPTAGSSHANALGAISWLSRPRQTIRDLTRDNPQLRDLNTWFRGFVPKNKIRAMVIREHKPVGKLGVIVSPSSADPGLPVSTPVIPVDEDHVSLSHPASRESEVYRLIADFLRAPFDDPHPDTLIADGLDGVKGAVQELGAGAEANADALRQGQQNIERELGRIVSQEHPAITRDAEDRLTRFRKIRFTAGFDQKQESGTLLNAIDGGDLSSASKAVRQSVFAWCARVLASVDHSAAEIAYSKAAQLGTSDETTIAEAFLKAFDPASNKAAALATLEHLDTPEAQTAKLIISAHGVAPEVALKWLQDTGLQLTQVDADGRFRVIGLQLTSDAWPAALETVEALTDGDYDACPCLHVSAATVHLGLAINEDIRSAILTNLFDQLEHIPLAEDAASMRHRAEAASHFRKAAVVLKALEADRAAAVAADQALVLALRDPASKNEAVATLEASMRDAKTRLRRLPMALSFGLELDMQAVEREIDAETALTGGKSVHAAIARLAIALRRKAPDVPAYIERHRKQLVEVYTPDFLDALTIEALAKAQMIDEARGKLEQLAARSAESPVIASLKTIIDEAAGADPVAAREADYAAHPSLQKLIVLVDHLKGRKDFPRLADYAGRLFDAVKDVPTAEVYSSALYETNQDEEIIEIEERYPEIVRASDNLVTNVSWAYYRLGKLKESKALLNEFRTKRDIQNDRFLSLNIAIASGDWSSLNALVESEWTHRDEREPVELLRAGTIAQRIGSSSRSQDLIRAAADKGRDDPEILANAYSAATSAGWENDETIHGWLASAIDKSGEDGPIRRFDIEELLELNPGWNERVDRAWDLLVKGEVPMFLAARVANRTLLDLYLRPALRNLQETDVRRRQVVFAFSGNKPVQKSPERRVAIDITALLTLMILDRLSDVLNWCESVTISHTTLGWLFEERDRLAFHQPSQVRRAREVKNLLDHKQLQRFEGAAPPPEFEQEVGDEIARYFVAAKTVDESDTTQRVVVRPSPLPKAGTLLKEEANVSGFEDNLAGCADVIRALRAAGHLTGAEEGRANAYLGTHEKPWPHNPTVQPGATLYLSDLAVSYFQHLGLLGRLSTAGFKVFVSASEIDRADELVGFDDAGDRARQVVEALQATLRDGIASGKVILGRLRPQAESDDRFEVHPSPLILADALGSDALVIDDRAMNRHATTGKTPIVNSLDLLSWIADTGELSEEALGEAWTLLRQAGFIFVPHRSGEILALLNAATVTQGELIETAELRAIRQSITRARMTDTLQLPAEALWIDDLTRELLSALRAQWTEVIKDSDARARSAWALGLLDARGWAHRSVSIGIDVAERYRAEVMMLLMLPSSEATTRERYWQWLEDVVLGDFKTEQPDSYRQLVANVEGLIDSSVKRPLPGMADE